MTLPFHPDVGTVLICDFNTGFKSPEMVKKRPVVVVSPRPRRRTQLCIVVPLSTTKPDPVEAFHHCLNPASLPGSLSKRQAWAKCDMLATVSLERLDRVRIKDSHRKRSYVAQSVLEEDLKAIRKCILAALGMS